MSKERSPRELCSTTIGTRGIGTPFRSSHLACRPARHWRASLSRPPGGLAGPVGGAKRPLADLEPDQARAAPLERPAQRREGCQQAVATVVGAVHVQPRPPPRAPP